MHPVAIGKDGKAAVARRRLLQHGQVKHRCGKTDRTEHIVPLHHRNTRLARGAAYPQRRRLVTPGLVEKRKARDHRRCGDALAENTVMVGKDGDSGRPQPLNHLGRQVAQHCCRRRPVRLGENDVEDDCDRAQLGQTINQIRRAVARPRPLSDGLQTAVVNIDNTHGRRLIDAGRGALKSIEQLEPSAFHRASRDVEQQRRCQHTQRHDEAYPAPNPRHRHSLPGGAPLRGAAIVSLARAVARAIPCRDYDGLLPSAHPVCLRKAPARADGEQPPAASEGRCCPSPEPRR